MSHDQSADVDYLRLQVTVALGVVPLISKAIAFIDDRQTIISDIVTCWLALPKETRNHYAHVERNVPAIVHFGFDYVETVEQPEQDNKSRLDGPDHNLDQWTFNQWMRQLKIAETRQLSRRYEVGLSVVGAAVLPA